MHKRLEGKWRGNEIAEDDDPGLAHVGLGLQLIAQNPANQRTRRRRHQIGKCTQQAEFRLIFWIYAAEI